MPDQNLGLVVELQANSPEDSNDPNELFSKGWTRIDLFDMSNRLLSGRYENSYIILIIISVGFFLLFYRILIYCLCSRWKIPIRISPIKAFLSTHELNMIPQVGLFFSFACTPLGWFVNIL